MTINIHCDDHYDLIIEIGVVQSEISKIDLALCRSDKQIENLNQEKLHLSQRGNKGALLGSILGIIGSGIGIGVGAGLGHLYDRWKHSLTAQDREIRTNQINKEISLITGELEKMNTVRSNWNEKLIIAKAELTKLYDSWPDYPPDWNDRKATIKKKYNNTCTKCKYRPRSKRADRRTMDVHHIHPLSKGGGHQATNLTVLCRPCHEKIHGRKIMFKGKSLKQTVNPSTLKFLQNAISHQEKVNIVYTDSEGCITARTILPLEFMKPGDWFLNGERQCNKSNTYLIGFCELRQEKRQFHLDRIMKTHHAS
jgi:hypothetical protein